MAAAIHRIAVVGAAADDVCRGQDIDRMLDQNVPVIEARREFGQEAGLEVDADGVCFTLLRLQSRVAPLQL